METIKLIIWDMDETFWKGTLSDGEVQPIQENIDIVKRLTDRGIVNSVCSKNDFDKTKDKLVEMGVWDYFVFPSIDWTNKGIRVKNIISDMGLRPINVLFLDDNINNLKEAQYECPTLQVATPDKLTELLKDPAFDGKDDSDHSRLKQYKILEKKAEARQQSSSNEEFLYQSDIHVELIEDCSDKLQRIHEMIHRNNQLNFTKDRISREEVDKLFTDSAVRKGVVHVTDKYGDHGIIGCYAIKDNVAKQFVFSCRILGMGVEQWVYAELGYPEITIVGEGANQLNKTDKPAWINQAGSANSAICTTGGGTDTPRLIVYGTCPLRPVWGYLQPKLPNAKFAEIDPAPPICNLAVAFRESREYLDDLCKKVNVFDAVNTFDRDIVDGKADYLLISVIQGTDNVWKYKSKTTDSYFYAWGKLNELTADKSILEDYEASPITFEDIKSDLCYLCEHLPANTTLIIQNAPEVIFSQGKDVDFYNRIKLNEIVEFIGSKYNNVRIVDIRKYAKTPADFFGEVANHYNRPIGYSQSKDIFLIMGLGGSNDTKIVKRDIIPANALKGSDLQLGKTEDKFGYVAFIRNGNFYINVKLTNADKYSVVVQFWRGRFIETSVELDNTLSYKLALTKKGYWNIKLIFKINNKDVYSCSVGGLPYNSYFYINYIDLEAEDYDLGINSQKQLCATEASDNNIISALYTQIANLSAIGVNIADYFINNNIKDIVMFTNIRLGEVILPYLHNSKINVKYVITCDQRWRHFADGGQYTYNMYTLDDVKNKKIIINNTDTIFVAVKGDYEEFWRSTLNKLTTARRINLPYVLNYLYTKTFFVDRFKSVNAPRILTVRTVNLDRYFGFNFNKIKANERSVLSNLKNANNVLRQLDSGLQLPEQYTNIPKEELKETLVKPAFYRDSFGIQKMRDRSGKYVNIKDGFRVTTGQPSNYDGIIYIIGDSKAYGCGNKDSDTIASKLQNFVSGKYKVENRANMFLNSGDYTTAGLSDALNLIEYLPVTKNDIVILILDNWRTTADNIVGLWPIWEAISDPIIKLDAFPVFEKQDRPDYFLLPEAYTAEGNQAIAELIADKLKEIGYLK